jgi:hypothetical protein
MNTNESPAPCANGESRANSKIERKKKRSAPGCKAKGYRTKRNLKAIVYLIAGDVLANSPI